jgi:signal transduction histidine kinase/DNA-binding response OmpR family regulator
LETLESEIIEIIKSIEQEEERITISTKLPTVNTGNLKISVRRKLIIAIIFIILSIILTVSYFSSAIMQRQSVKLSNSIIDELLDKIQFAITIEKNSNRVYNMFNILNDQQLNLCREVAQKIKNDNSILQTQKLKELAAEIGADEIHVIDENGVLTHSSVAEISGMIGLNFYLREQTLPFTEILSDTGLEIAQNPQKRGVDREIAQYIGVARKDKKGIVQIGYVIPTKNILEQIEFENFLKNMNFSFNGGCMIISDNGTIIADSRGEKTEKRFENISIKDILKKQEKIPFYFSFNGSKMYGKITNYKNITILGYINYDYVQNISLKSVSYAILFIFTLLAFLSAILFFLTVKLTISPLEKINEEIESLKQGSFLNLNRHCSNKEILTFALEINKMIMRMTYSNKSLSKAREIKKMLQNLLFTESISLRLSNAFIGIQEFNGCISKLISIINDSINYVSKSHIIRIAFLDAEKNKMCLHKQYCFPVSISTDATEDAMDALINGDAIPDDLAQGCFPPIIYCENVAAEQKYESITKAGIKSFLISPIYINGKYKAALTIEIFDDFAKFDKIDKKIIRNVCSVIASTIIRKEAEEDKNKAILISEISNKSKIEFLATISHEIITPINSIVGLSEIASQKKNVNEDIQEYFEKILKNGVNLLEIVNKIFEFLKIQQNQITIIPKEYDLKNMIKDIYDTNIKNTENSSIIFALDIDPKLPRKMFGDNNKIKNILNNLISNALKFTNKGRITISLKEETRNEMEVGINFSVKDTGIGIDALSQKNMLSGFSQIDSSFSKKHGGIGIGFSIARELVKIMGGKIKILSEVGIGSEFSFLINQTIIDSTPIGNFEISDIAAANPSNILQNKNEPSPMNKNLYMPYGKVLVVDDVKANLDVAKELLLCYGLDVDCVLNGESAINKIKSEEKIYDIVLMDHMMPTMDGIETVKRIRGINSDYAKNIIIVALTANVAISDNIFYKNGFNYHIKKPISKSNIESILMKYIHSKQDNKTLNLTEEESKETITVENNELIARNYLNNINIKGLNITLALDNFGQMADLYIKILDSFVKNIPPLIQNLLIVKYETLNEYTILIHGIKGSYYGIGAMECGNLAKEAEIFAKKGDIEQVLFTNKLLTESTNNLVSEIKKLLIDFDDIKKQYNPRETRETPDEELLKELLQAVIDYDINSMNKIIAKLDQFTYSKNSELIAFIKEQTQEFAYDKIEKKLIEALLE